MGFTLSTSVTHCIDLNFKLHRFFCQTNIDWSLLTVMLNGNLDFVNKVEGFSFHLLLVLFVGYGYSFRLSHPSCAEVVCGVASKYVWKIEDFNFTPHDDVYRLLTTGMIEKNSLSYPPPPPPGRTGRIFHFYFIQFSNTPIKNEEFFHNIVI